MAFDFSFDALKNSFFDTKAVMAAAKNEYRKTASRFGAYTRTRMKSSLRYKPGKSKPGHPPHVHRSRSKYTRPKKATDGTTVRRQVSPLKELIFFAFDHETQSVVIGPVKFGTAADVKVPGLLEKGGAGTFKAGRSGERKRGVWSARPFVKPAGDAEAQSGKFLKG
ncbi:Uncharacterized protein OS=Isosphaera pallida (strain ATCC 43644 / DSM 9630 / IS1B) GN=Isop_2430 PE=4 SV=1 [Gemmata massiliana]|uniref:Uncharacterized protein n=1 Tax=Gemmata massiliana TaxID=1210884 RepID=A0A6P2CW36_9BACT|nr:hypothetical protein [Gemmata massiliana]VTR92817.1 Uncharacterized protein OS=Isosphaera pallida (strain ATCC 43644 / DSM 9630 / IS1B) GN=Isop_2430 PE=4 SV=1 [Gemmata massiliana]